MAALGTIGTYTPPAGPVQVAVTDYNIQRGRALGAIGTYLPIDDSPEPHGPLTTYIVRQIRILYRQLWPSHGQRFPQ